jgi:hypothetical protein
VLQIPTITHYLYLSFGKNFNKIETRAVIKFFFPLQCKVPTEFLAILRETLGGDAPSYATVKKCVAPFKCGDFSTFSAPRLGRHKTVTTPEITDHIHELIFEDLKISFKSTGEQLSISLDRVGFIIHEYLYMRNLREVSTEMPESGTKT